MTKMYQDASTSSADDNDNINDDPVDQGIDEEFVPDIGDVD